MKNKSDVNWNYVTTFNIVYQEQGDCIDVTP